MGEERDKLMPSPSRALCLGREFISSWALRERLVGGMETILSEGFLLIWIPLNLKKKLFICFVSSCCFPRPNSKHW